MKTTFFKNILVPTDLTPHSFLAFDFAADLANWHGATLHVVYVAQESLLNITNEPDSEDSKTSGADTLRPLFWDRLPAALRNAESFKPSVHSGFSVSDTIIDYKQSENIDLIVMGKHGHRNLRNLTGLGGTSASILRRSKEPVLTCRSANDGEGATWTPPKHILVPIDFSKQSKKILQRAKAWAAHYNASLSLLFVAEERTVPVFNDTLIPSIYVMKPDASLLAHAGEALSQLYEGIEGPEVTVTYHIRHGNPAKEILSFIEEQNVDLVMMNSHGLTSAKQFSLGSTSERIARKAQCAVFTLKTK